MHMGPVLVLEVFFPPLFREGTTVKSCPIPSSTATDLWWQSLRYSDSLDVKSLFIPVTNKRLWRVAIFLCRGPPSILLELPIIGCVLPHFAQPRRSDHRTKSYFVPWGHEFPLMELEETDYYYSQKQEAKLRRTPAIPWKSWIRLGNRHRYEDRMVVHDVKYKLQ